MSQLLATTCGFLAIAVFLVFYRRITLDKPPQDILDRIIRIIPLPIYGLAGVLSNLYAIAYLFLKLRRIEVFGVEYVSVCSAILLLVVILLIGAFLFYVNWQLDQNWK
jgi:hypothetical protein